MITSGTKDGQSTAEMKAEAYGQALRRKMSRLRVYIILGRIGAFVAHLQATEAHQLSATWARDVAHVHELPAAELILRFTSAPFNDWFAKPRRRL